MRPTLPASSASTALGDGEVGLAVPAAPGQNQIAGVDGVDELLLARRFGFYRLQIGLLAIIVQRQRCPAAGRRRRRTLASSSN